MVHNFAQVLLGSAQEAGSQPALHLLVKGAPDQTLSYADLVQAASAYAQSLQAAGIQPGEIVIIILDHGPDLTAAFWGTVLQGAVPSIMPFLTEKLSKDQYRQSLASLFEITQPAAIITSSVFESEALLAAQAHPGLRAVLVEEKIAPSASWQSQYFPGLGRQPDEVVMLQHSSGTTGLQKGVALSHQAVFNQLESFSLAIDLNPNDVVVSWLPLYHDMGLIAGFLMPVLRRIPLVLMSPFDWVRAPYKLLQAVSHYQGTLTWLPNFAFNFCAQKIRARDLEGVDLSSWRAVINCSEPMYSQSHQMFLERFQPYGLRPSALATSYAMAENVFAVTQGGIHSAVREDRIDAKLLLAQQIAKTADDPAESLTMLSAGKPLHNTQVRILNDQGEDLPERRVGEIAIQSNCMLNGYYRRPDLTRQAFLDGWYLTGDLGYQADGELYITGRKKDLIIVGGKNIYPQDLERIASGVPGVHPGRVVAFGIPDLTAGTEEVVLLAEPENDITHPGEVENEIRRQVTQGSAVALRRVHLVPRGWLLKTSSGKIARKVNREKYLRNFGTEAASGM